MKKILILMVFCLLSIGAIAQEHLTFKGIPIDGSLSSFVTKLKTQGFKVMSSDTSFAQLEGNFGGELCTILVNTTKKTGIVYNVCVALPESSSWSSIKNKYEEYKSSLTEKYTKPQSIEEFKDPYYEGDGYEMTALKTNKCTYISRFLLKNGIIYLSMTNLTNLFIIYEDNVNSEINKSEEKSKVYDDL